MRASPCAPTSCWCQPLLNACQPCPRTRGPTALCGALLAGVLCPALPAEATACGGAGQVLERAVGYVALTALAWAPLTWSAGQAILNGGSADIDGTQQSEPPGRRGQRLPSWCAANQPYLPWFARQPPKAWPKAPRIVRALPCLCTAAGCSRSGCTLGLPPPRRLAAWAEFSELRRSCSSEPDMNVQARPPRLPPGSPQSAPRLRSRPWQAPRRSRGVPGTPCSCSAQGRCCSRWAPALPYLSLTVCHALGAPAGAGSAHAWAPSENSGASHRAVPCDSTRAASCSLLTLAALGMVQSGCRTGSQCVAGSDSTWTARCSTGDWCGCQSAV